MLRASSSRSAASSSFLDPACHESIGFFDLAIGLWVRYIFVVERNVLVFQKDRNSSAMKFVPLSVMILLGTPKRI